MADKLTLSADLKDKFKMAPNFNPGKFIFARKEIDLTTADLATVEEAVKNGFDVVVPIKESKPTAK